ATPAEDWHQVIVEAEEEPRRSRIALPTRASAKLVVDPAGLVTLGPQNVQPAHTRDLVVFAPALRAHPRERLLVGLVPLRDGSLRRLHPAQHELLPGQELGISSQ